MVTYSQTMHTTTITPLVAEQVRRAIDEAGLTKAGTARITGTPRTTFKRQYDGHQPFTFDQILKIMDETGKPIEYFCPIPDLTGGTT